MSRTMRFPARVALDDGREMIHAGQCPYCQPGIHVYRWTDDGTIAWECTAEEMRDSLAAGWGREIEQSPAPSAGPAPTEEHGR